LIDKMAHLRTTMAGNAPRYRGKPIVLELSGCRLLVLNWLASFDFGFWPLADLTPVLMGARQCSRHF
jgi:hypothetical protein